VELYFYLHHMLYDLQRDKCTVTLSCLGQNTVLSRRITAHVIGMCIPCMVLTRVLRYFTHMYIVHIVLTLPVDGRPNGLDSNRGTEVT